MAYTDEHFGFYCNHTFISIRIFFRLAWLRRIGHTPANGLPHCLCLEEEMPGGGQKILRSLYGSAALRGRRDAQFILELTAQRIFELIAFCSPGFQGRGNSDQNRSGEIRQNHGLRVH